MNLFEIVNWNLKVDTIAWGYDPFKKILARDKSKDKVTAMKEMLFIYSYTDLRSDYMSITDEVERELKIKEDIGLPEKWSYDATMKVAVDFYREQSITIIGKLYLSATIAVSAVNTELNNASALLKERDSNGKPVTKIGDITKALKDVPIIMTNLKAAEKEVIKEKKQLEGRSKGAKTFNTLEDGVGEI